MVRLLGACLLILGGWGIGAACTSRERGRLAEGEAYLDFLRFIRAQLASFCRPREELFAMYENACLGKNGFLGALRESGSIRTALETAHSHASDEVREWLCAFDRELGRSYLDGQLAACDFYTARLETYIGDLRTRLPARMRIARTTSLAGAMLLALLLL